MLAVSPLRNNIAKDENNRGEMESFSIGSDDFADFSAGNLLECIDFDSLFVNINDGDILPDLEMDPELLAEFSISGGEEYSETKTCESSFEKVENFALRKEEDDDKLEDCVSSEKDESVVVKASNKDSRINKGKSKSVQEKNNSQGKRKVKVDWTPELHRRFVQAVEQLGVDKAVPSRILEIMGIDCLTRHNIASHLQKYRSHRKHLLAREAEAASWTQRRHVYGSATTGGGGKRNVNPWLVPTIGFPPMTPPPPMHHHVRPLHVWGHPSVDQSLTHMWPKHIAHSPSPPPQPAPVWAPQQPSPDSSYWHPPVHQHVANGLSRGTPCFPPPLATTRFPNPHVPGIMPPHGMYKVHPGIAVQPAQSGPRPPFDLQPSKESIDAAIGDVISKPWLPLPIGLKPPSLDGVMGELQRQGVPKIPPSCS